MKAHAMDHYLTDGPAWPEGLKLAEADEETTWRILHAGVSLLFTTDTLLAGVADPPQAPAEETPHTRHLNVLTRVSCEHALTKRLPDAVRDSIRFRLATHLLDNGDTEAGQAHLRKLMEGNTYYSVFCAHGLREDADTLPGQPPQWDQVEVFETYPWLVDYLEP